MLLCVGACHVVVLEVIPCGFEVAALYLMVLDVVIPHIVEGSSCSKLCPVVAVLLCEAFDDGWPSVVDGSENCVVHNVCCV